MSKEEEDIHAQRIWDFHHVNHALRESDCIIGLGSHDPRVAVRAAQLYLDGWAPLLVFSGGLGNFTRGVWDRPEADVFRDVAVAMGIPDEKILVENRSANSGENIEFTKAVLEQHDLHPESFILVQKPYMERRAFLTFQKHWPGKHVIVTSPQVPYGEYPTDKISREDVINIIVGDLHRIKVYPRLGYQSFQEIPADVWESFKFLVNRGYTSHLIPGEPVD